MKLTLNELVAFAELWTTMQLRGRAARELLLRAYVRKRNKTSSEALEARRRAIVRERRENRRGKHAK